MSEISSSHSVTVDFVWGKMEKIIFDFGESNSPGWWAWLNHWNVSGQVVLSRPGWHIVKESFKTEVLQYEHLD